MNLLSVFSGPYALLARWVVIGVLLGAFGGWCYTKGISHESNRRDAAELAQSREDAKLYAQAMAYGIGQAKKLQAAEQRADDNYDAWKEARDELRRKGTPLAVASCPAADAGQGPASPRAQDPPRPAPVRFTWSFVGLFDSVWTGTNGQPLFLNSARAEKETAGPGAASPYGPDEILEVHGENAKRFDACRRQLNQLIETIDGLERQWNER